MKWVSSWSAARGNKSATITKCGKNYVWVVETRGLDFGFGDCARVEKTERGSALSWPQKSP